jgi:uncharacterized protein YacL (UPF0231 family)
MEYTYTFIMDYLGGTYISQVKASSNREAIGKWLRDLKIEEIEKFTKEDQESLIKSGFEDEEPVLITGMKNVWNTNVRTRKGLGYVHFVKTASEE